MSTHIQASLPYLIKRLDLPATYPGYHLKYEQKFIFHLILSFEMSVYMHLRCM
jgi:hypothetical protein